METPHKPQSASPGRESLLTVILTGLAAGGFLFFMILVTGGFFFYVVLSLAVIVGLGFFHYMLWGYAMTAEVMEEEALDPEAGWEALQGARTRQDKIKRLNGDGAGPETRIK